MKPRLPPPDVPGGTDAERMDNAVRKMFSVSKDELLKREAAWKQAQARKKRAKGEISGREGRGGPARNHVWREAVRS